METAAPVVAHPPRRTHPRPGPSGLEARGAPALLLPAEHFAAALCFWIAGAAGLVWVAPDLARGAFPLPRVVAVAHLFTLGWITTSILGALYHLLPVVVGTPIRSQRLAHLGFALHVPGLALFVGGMLAGSHGAMLPGAALLSAGLLCFLCNLAATLRAAAVRTLTWWALAAAGTALFATVVLGASLTGNLRWGYLGTGRLAAIGVHLHVAVAGWVLLVIVGVAHRLLPMFLLAHRAPGWPGRLAVGMLASGVALLLGAHHFLVPVVLWTVAVLLSGGLVAFLAQAVLLFRHRRKPTLDAGLRLAGIALVFLAIALVLAPFHLVYGATAPRLATAYGVALVLGGPTLLVAGYYYTIVPILVRFHRFAPRAGERPVLAAADPYHHGASGAASALLGGGTAALVLATLTGAVWMARPAALAFAAGAAILCVQTVLIVRKGPA
jgi:hypothetical protein